MRTETKLYLLLPLFLYLLSGKGHAQSIDQNFEQMDAYFGVSGFENPIAGVCNGQVGLFYAKSTRLIVAESCTMDIKVDLSPTDTLAGSSYNRSLTWHLLGSKVKFIHWIFGLHDRHYRGSLSTSIVDHSSQNSTINALIESRQQELNFGLAGMFVFKSGITIGTNFSPIVLWSKKSRRIGSVSTSANTDMSASEIDNAIYKVEEQAVEFFSPLVQFSVGYSF